MQRQILYTKGGTEYGIEPPGTAPYSTYSTTDPVPAPGAAQGGTVLHSTGQGRAVGDARPDCQKRLHFGPWGVIGLLECGPRVVCWKGMELPPLLRVSRGGGGKNSRLLVMIMSGVLVWWASPGEI